MLSGQLQCWDDAKYSRAVSRALGRPVPATAFKQAVRQARSFNAACRKNAAELLPYVGTDYVARDIDLLRQALGERQLTFYGRSFGSYIGTVYADLFPQRVRAVVLDGGYDPRRYANRPYAYDRTQYLALDAAVQRFFAWCGRTPSMCTFGDGQPRAAFEQLTRALDAAPVPIPGQGRANGYTLAYRLMFNINGGKARLARARDGVAASTTTRQHVVSAAAAVAGVLRLPHRQCRRRVHRPRLSSQPRTAQA